MKRQAQLFSWVSSLIPKVNESFLYEIRITGSTANRKESAYMSKYSLDEFIRNTKQDEQSNEFFELETPRILEVNLQDLVWAKMGSMISYTGDIKFERERVLEHGLGKMFKKALTGEGTALMKAAGNGRLYLADQGK